MYSIKTTANDLNNDILLFPCHLIVTWQATAPVKDISQKKAIYERYKEGFKDLPIQMNPIVADSEPNYWLSAMIMDTGGRTCHFLKEKP